MKENTIGNKLYEKLRRAGETIGNKKVILAYSGGADSTLLLMIALKFAEHVIPVYIRAPINPEEEFGFVRELCSALKIRPKIVEMDVLSRPDFQKNPVDRCYFCKKNIMGTLDGIRKEMGFDTVIEGTNASDVGGHRPGFRALRELGVISPLYAAGLTKPEIRAALRLIAEKNGGFIPSDADIPSVKKLLLKVADKPEGSCLATRVEYGSPVTAKKINMIYKAETFLLGNFAIKNVRVRVHGEHMARIEVSREDFDIIVTPENFDKIARYLRSLGFGPITFDIEGYRCGSMLETAKGND